MSKNNNCCKKTSIGGQALMEGIMMRGPEVSAMAVRNTKGEIVLEKFPTETKKRAKFFKLPIIRGLFNYIDSMSMGTKCLLRSAEISGLEEAEEELRREKEAKKAEKEAKKAAKKGVKPEETVETAKIEVIEDTVAPEKKGDPLEEVVNDMVVNDPTSADESEEPVAEEKPADNKKKKDDTSVTIGILMTVSVILSIALSIGLFLVLPTFVYSGATHLIPALRSEDLFVNSLIQSVFEGVIKLILIIGYMALMTLMKDIKRTFQFHGAEHKTIFCYEAGLELTVENVRKQRRFHPRCGTSFLILMIIVSIFIGFFITPLYILILGEETIQALGEPMMNAIRSATKILLIPLIVGIGYELIKLAGKHDNWLTRIISAPGVWLQHITVLEPDDSMIECAIAAMNEVIPEDDSDKW